MNATLRARPDTRQYIHDGNVRILLIDICEQALCSDGGVVLGRPVTVAWASKPGGPADTSVQLESGSRVGKIHSCDPNALAFRFELTTGRELIVHADNNRMWVVRS